MTQYILLFKSVNQQMCNKSAFSHSNTVFFSDLLFNKTMPSKFLTWHKATLNFSSFAHCHLLYPFNQTCQTYSQAHLTYQHGYDFWIHSRYLSFYIRGIYSKCQA